MISKVCSMQFQLSYPHTNHIYNAGMEYSQSDLCRVIFSISIVVIKNRNTIISLCHRLVEKETKGRKEEQDK